MICDSNRLRMEVALQVFKRADQAAPWSFGISMNPLWHSELHVVSDPNLVPTRRYTLAGTATHIRQGRTWVACPDECFLPAASSVVLRISHAALHTRCSITRASHSVFRTPNLTLRMAVHEC